jgi:hypothetical protein
MDLEQFEQKIFSQNGEDGITMKLLGLLYDNHDSKYYVEFGVENGMECNTRILREKYGWKGLQMDGGNENPAIHLQKEFITKDNVVELFKKYNVPQHINLLSVDIDYNDFYCLHEILKSYICDILICEYNGTHLPCEDKVVISNSNTWWDGTNYFGASLLAISNLGKMYGYSVVYCDSKGINCFLIRDDLICSKSLSFKNFGSIELLYKSPKYGCGPNGGHEHDWYNRPYITSKEAIGNQYLR